MKSLLPFSKQFLGWVFYVSSCATPSFILAFIIGYRTLPAILGMILAIMAFILFFTLAETCLEKLPFPNLHQSVTWAIRIRAASSLIGSIFFLVPDPLQEILVVLLSPDIWIGHLVIDFMASLHGKEFLEERFVTEDMTSFFSTFCTTLLDGALLSTTFFILIPIAYAVIHVRKIIQKPTISPRL